MSKQREIYYEASLYNRKKNVSSFYMIQCLKPIRDMHSLRMNDMRSIDIKIYQKTMIYLKKKSFAIIV